MDLGNNMMVSESDKLLIRLLRGTSDTNIPFEGRCRLLRNLGFEERTRGSHHIFTRTGWKKSSIPRPKQATPNLTKSNR